MPGPLSFETQIDTTNFLNGIQRMNQGMVSLSRTAKKETDSMDLSFKRLSQLAAGYFTFSELSQLPAQIVKVRGEFQKLEIAFSTMLKSKAAGDQLLRESVQLAATTPFSLRDVASGAKQLLAYGSTAQSVIGELRTLGDVAAGTGTQIGDLVYLYGTLRSQGRAYAVDIRQFAGRGIPIYAELAKVLGVNIDQVNSFVEAGKVGFKEVEMAFKNMTTGSGLFSGLMEAQSKSLTGMLERLGDAWDQMLNKIGQQNEGILAGAINTTTDLVENYEQVLDILTVVVATYGTYKAGLIAIAAAQRLVASSSTATLFLEMAQSLGAVTTATKVQTVALAAQTKAQAALNAVMAVNPYILMAAAIAGVAATVWVLHDGTTAAEKAQKALNDALERNKEQRQQMAATTSELTGIITSQTATTYSQLEAYEKLQGLYPLLLKNLSLQEFQALGTEEAQRKLNAAMDAVSIARVSESFEAAKRKVQEYETQLRNLQQQKNELGPQSSGLNLTIEDTRKAYEAAKIEAEKLGEQVEANAKREWEANTSVKDKVKYYEELIRTLEAEEKSIREGIKGLRETGQVANSIKPFFDELRLTWLLGDLEQAKVSLKALKPGNPQLGGDKAYWEGVKKNATEALEKMGTSQKGSTEWNRLSKEINTASKELEKYDVVERKTSRKPKKIEIVIEKGSEADLEKQINTLNEKISKTNPAKIGLIQKYIAERTQLERKAEELRKEHSVQTFEEELEQRQKKYALYQKWVEAYGKEAADKQFSSLLKGGTDFNSSLKGQLMGYDLKRGSGVTLSKEELAQYQRLKELIADTDGHETILERFNKDLQAAKDNAGSITEQIANLKQLQAALDPKDNSETGIAKRQGIAEALNESYKARREQVQEFLKSVVGSEEERLAIEKHYANLRTGLEEQYGTDRGEAYQKALASINKDEQKALKERKDRIFEESDAYKELQKIIIESGLEAMDVRIARLKKTRDEAIKIYGSESEKVKELDKEIQESQQKRTSAQIEHYLQFSQVAGELGQVLSEVNGTIGEAGQLLAGMASGINNLSIALKRTEDGKVGVDQYVAAGSAAVSLIGLIAGSAQQRKLAETEYYRSVIAYQQQYNLLLNNQIGIQSQLKESVFVKDYAGRARDGLKQYANAQEEYQKVLDKLAEGRAKNGQKDGIDGKAVGQGAAAGAALGSVVLPGIGTAVGAGVGAIIGLFAGKKKQDTWGALLEMYPGLVKKGADGWEELDKNVAQTLISTGQLDEDTKQLVENAVDWTEKIEEAREKIREVIRELAGGLGDQLRNSLVDAFKAGEDAAEAMRKTVSGVLEDLLSKIIFSKVFAAAFKDFENQLAPALATGDPQAITDVFRNLFDKLPGLAETANKLFKMAKDYGKEKGFDLFSNTSTTRAKGMAGQVQSVTEETASALVGQMNAIRISQVNSQNLLNQQLQVQYQISNNTFQLYAISSTLVDIKKQLASDPLRAKGLTG